MVSGGVWGVSGGCLVSVLGLLVVSGVCWVVSGGCFRHFFRSGHFVPPPCHTGIQDPASNRVKLGNFVKIFYPHSLCPKCSKLNLGILAFFS